MKASIKIFGAGIAVLLVLVSLSPALSTIDHEGIEIIHSCPFQGAPELGSGSSEVCDYYIVGIKRIRKQQGVV